MKAAIVRGPGERPVYGDFPTPQPAAGEEIVHVAASAISQVTRSRASGRHYTSDGRFPFVAGVDGVGRLTDGRRIYFVLPRAPNGAMAEQTAIPREQCLSVPDDLDDVTAAAIANPGMSSWAAYVERARLKPGETVLVNGATGISGRLAVQIAKHLGAKKVVATGRDPDALRAVQALGADVVVSLTEDPHELEDKLKEQFASAIDVVIDYLWGASAQTALIAAGKASPEAVPVRFVAVGAASSGEISLPNAVLRSSAIVLMGSGIGSIESRRLMKAIAALLKASSSAGLRIATRAVSLSEIETVWDEQRSERTVLTIR